MLMLAFVFQTLAIRKPTLDSGVYAYAKAGFGEYLGLLLRVRILGERVRRQHDLLGVDHVDGRRDRARARRGRHAGCGSPLDGRCVGVRRPDHARSEGGDVDQPDRDRRQGHPDPRVHRPRTVHTGSRRVRRQHERRGPRIPLRTGAGHDARDRLRVPRRRGRERLLALRAAPRARRARHGARLRQRAGGVRERDDRLVRHPPACGDRAAPAAVDGRRARGSSRGLGRGVRERRPHRVRARRVPGVEPDGRRGAVRRRQGRRHAAVPQTREQPGRTGRRAADDDGADPDHVVRDAGVAATRSTSCST